MAQSPLALHLKVVRTDGTIDDPTFYCHQDTVVIGASTYYLMKPDIPADASGTTLSVSSQTTGIKVWGKFVFQLAGISTISAGTIAAIFRAWVSNKTAVINGQIDIIIRTAANGVRATIATNVSVSASTSSTAAVTLTGANYSFSEYSVVDQTDYLEIDFLCNVTTLKSGSYAYLRIDDNTLATANQSQSTGWVIPAPSPPTSLASPSQTESTINLTWTKGANTDKTLIRFRDDQYPTGVTDGYEAYLDTGESVTVDGSGQSKLQQLNNNYTLLYSGSIIRDGERVNSFPVGNISRVSFLLYKLGVPTGTAYIRIRKVSDDSILATIGTIDVATLTTNPTWKDFDCNVDNTTIQDLRFTIEYDGGNITNAVVVQEQTSDVLANAVISYFTDSWQDISVTDLAIKIYYSITLTPATTYYFLPWGYQSSTGLYSDPGEGLIQATSGAPPTLGPQMGFVNFQDPGIV